MMPKIVIVLTRNGVEAVTISSNSPLERNFGYEICKGIEHELAILDAAIRRKFLEPKEEKHGKKFSS